MFSDPPKEKQNKEQAPVKVNLEAGYSHTLKNGISDRSSKVWWKCLCTVH